jgi:hypothetical protein
MECQPVANSFVAFVILAILGWVIIATLFATHGVLGI